MLVNIKSRKVRLTRYWRTLDLRRVEGRFLCSFLGGLMSHFPGDIPEFNDKPVFGYVNITLTDERETNVILERTAENYYGRNSYLLTAYGVKTKLCAKDLTLFTGISLKVGELVYIDSLWFSKT